MIADAFKSGSAWIPYTGILNVFVVNTKKLKPEEYPKTWADLAQPRFKNLVSMADAEKSVKTQLILDAIVENEQIGVNDAELTERIIYQAQRFGVSPDEYVKRAQESGQLAAIFADVRRGKALASVVRKAAVTDADGAAVDLDELFGRQDESADLPSIESESEESPVDEGAVTK